MSYPDNATASLAQFLFRDSQGAMYIIPRRAFHNGSQYGDTVTIVQDLSGNGNDLTGTAVFDRKPFAVTDQETLNNIRDAQIIRDVNMTAPVGNLGTGCTVVRVEPGWPVKFDDLDINGNYQVTEDFSILIIIDRALTEPEVRVIEEMGEKWGGGTFNPLVNYANGEQGVYLAPWDISTLWQDDARTVPVENYGDPVRVMDDLSPNGNHSVAPTSAARGTYGRMPVGGRRNLLLDTEDMSSWNQTSECDVVTGIDDPDGGNNAVRVTGVSGFGRFGRSAVLSIPSGDVRSEFWCRAVGTVAADGVSVNRLNINGQSTARFFGSQLIADQWVKVRIGETLSASSNAWQIRTLGTTIDIYQPQCQSGTEYTPYQRVGNEYDVSQEGVPDVYYIETDGIDDCYQTAPIDLTMYDSTSLAVGVQYLGPISTGTRFVAEFSTNASSSNGSYSLYQRLADQFYGASHRGTENAAISATVAGDNLISVRSMSASISEPDLTAILQGELLNTTESQGTGTLGDYSLNLLSRNASSLFFQGRFFGAIIVHPRSPYEEQNRQFLAKKAGVTL